MADTHVIADAINGRRLLALRYHDVERRVRPHILGHVGQGRLALSGWQVEGTGSGWRLFHLDEIEALADTGERFRSSAPGYNPRDPAFSCVIARL
jgi:predicted DNA-binding transcriptional regulator YafY